jgi:hypothetical protein
MGGAVAVNGRGGAGWGFARPDREPCRKKVRVRAGSAGVVQGAELFDQQFAGDQSQLEIEWALHEDLDGFLGGHGILLPWECLVASSAVAVTYLIGGFVGKLDWGKRKTGISDEGKSSLCPGGILTR